MAIAGLDGMRLGVSKTFLLIWRVLAINASNAILWDKSELQSSEVHGMVRFNDKSSQSTKGAHPESPDVGLSDLNSKFVNNRPATSTQNESGTVKTPRTYTPWIANL